MLDSALFLLGFVLYKDGASCSYHAYGGTHGGKDLELSVCASKCSHAVLFNFRQSDGYCDCLTIADENGGCSWSEYSGWNVYRIKVWIVACLPVYVQLVRNRQNYSFGRVRTEDICRNLPRSGMLVVRHRHGPNSVAIRRWLGYLVGIRNITRNSIYLNMQFQDTIRIPYCIQDTACIRKYLQNNDDAENFVHRKFSYSLASYCSLLNA